MATASNRTVVITGAANGLGKALAEEFFSLGFSLALIDIDRAGLAAIQRDTSKPLQKVTTHYSDISIEEEVIKTAREIANQHSGIDILVNNAAISISQTFEQTQSADFNKLISVNFWGPVYCTRYFLPFLYKSSDAHIANIISGFALIGFPGKTAYASSKGALMSFTNSLKTELSGSNIKLSLVIPPPLDTMIVKNGLHISDEKREAEAAFLAREGMSLEKAAQLIVAGILKGKYRILVGAKTKMLDALARFFPSAIHSLIGRKKKSIEFV